LILKLAMPDLPFMDRMGVVFLLALVLAVAVSLLKPVDRATNTIETGGMSYATTLGWNIGALGVVMILAALYSTWW
jgi:SSS family solute:Na+ symporter